MPLVLKRSTIVRSSMAAQLAERTANAYSADRYRSWKAVAALLLRRGYTMEEAEAIMRSKWMRWAADSMPHEYGRVPALAIAKFLDSDDPTRLKYAVAELVARSR